MEDDAADADASLADGGRVGGGTSSTDSSEEYSRRVAEVSRRPSAGRLARVVDRARRLREASRRRLAVAAGAGAVAAGAAGAAGAPAGSSEEEEEDSRDQTEDSKESLTQSESTSEEDDGGESGAGIARHALLGPAEDRRRLASIVRRFRRDDLADVHDELEAAVWMQVHQMGHGAVVAHAVLSCGLWLLFRPREDFGALLLTKKGRVIHYGKSQLAQPGGVCQYLIQVLFGLALLLALGIASAGWLNGAPNVRVAFQGTGWIWWAYLAVSGTLVLLAAYGHRTRRDCGSTFRQHFEVTSLNAASYSRVDTGRRCQYGCARRRRGHLRLAFGRLYPDAVAMSQGLPEGAPHAGGLAPAKQLPTASAGEQSLRRREEVESSRSHNGFGPFTTALLAVLGVVGASYEYTEFLRNSYDGFKVCARKVAGCQWRVDNTPWVGRKRSIDGAYPPHDYASAGCNDKGEYCDVYYRPSDYCVADRENVDRTAVRLTCASLSFLLRAVRQSTYQDALGVTHVRYVVTKDVTVHTLPSNQLPYGGSVRLDEGMTLRSVGGSRSRESRLLQRDLRFAADAGAHLQQMCQGSVKGSLDLSFHMLPAESPLFEEDCASLQASCLAENYGPMTNSWWPPNRLWNHKLESKRTVCMYRAMPARLAVGGRVWRLLDDHKVEGLTCHGEPLQRLTFHGDDVEPCKDACAALPGCEYIFFGPEPSGEAAGAPRGDAAPRRCWLYAACPDAEEAAPAQARFEPFPCGDR